MPFSMLSGANYGIGPQAWIGLALFFLAGCATGPDFARPRPVELSPLEPIAWRPYQPYAYRRICLLPFRGPQGMERLGTALAEIYRQGLMQHGVFSAPTVFSETAHRQEPPLEGGTGTGDCGLVLAGTIERIHDGSGALPTIVEVTVRIFDIDRRTVLWEVMQKGRSWPSPDVDLFWNVVSGGGAADCRETARRMARQFAFFLKGEKDPTTGQDAPWKTGGLGYECEDR